jgi:hypothetical protein
MPLHLYLSCVPCSRVRLTCVLPDITLRIFLAPIAAQLALNTAAASDSSLRREDDASRVYWSRLAGTRYALLMPDEAAVLP